MKETRCPPTRFLPAERAGEEDVRKAFSTIVAAPMFQKILDMVPDPVMILNPQRQVVYCNRAALQMLSASNVEKVLGLRTGEALRCIHSDETTGGCGTTEFCRECGSPKALLQAQKGGQGLAECRIVTKGGDALDLRVWAAEFQLSGSRFTAYAVTDTSHEKRRRALEKIFFHDVLNTATGLHCLSALFQEATPEQRVEFQEELSGLSDRLIDEIMAQRQLSAAENEELQPTFEPVNSQAILDEIASAFRHHDAAQGKSFRIDESAVKKTFTTDKTLLHRVVANMVKNALEASRTGDVVTLGCDERDGGLEFWVHNPAVMSRSIQLQMFQRSFSTKGTGRGLGTYSMKLLTERYLKGTITFTSEEGRGTRFTARYPIRA